MKAKTIVGLMACAVLVPAFADIDNNKPTTNDWFSTSVPESTIVASGAAWATEGSVTPPTVDATARVMVIDADTAKPATLTPTTTDSKTAADLASDGLVSITSVAYLAPSATNDLPTAEALAGAQVGFAVAVNGESVTNYYGYVRTGENAGNWFALTGATPPVGEGNTTFTIVLDYRSTDKKVSFVVDSTTDSTTLADGNSATAFTFVPVNAKLSDVAAIGSGTITSIDAKYEKAVAAVNDVRYGTIAEAYTAAGNSGTVAVWDPASGTAPSNQKAANGLYKAACMALNIAEDAEIGLVPAQTQVAGNICLATAVAPVDGVNVKFAVSKNNGTATGEFDADSIRITKESGSNTYKIVPTINGASGVAP